LFESVIAPNVQGGIGRVRGVECFASLDAGLVVRSLRLGGFAPLRFNFFIAKRFNFFIAKTPRRKGRSEDLRFERSRRFDAATTSRDV